MTQPWRLRTLRAPRYLPGLDLMAVAPDGALAGFCVCWLSADRESGQIEPLGVHPAWRHRGLAQALMREAFRRLRDHDAVVALVEPWERDAPANRAYAEAGFRHAHTIVRRGRWM